MRKTIETAQAEICRKIIYKDLCSRNFKNINDTLEKVMEVIDDDEEFAMNLFLEELAKRNLEILNLTKAKQLNN